MLQGLTEQYSHFITVMQNKKTLPSFAIARSKLALEETTILEWAKQESALVAHSQNSDKDMNHQNSSQVGTPKKVARTPTVAQTMAPVLVADVETTNNSGSLGLGCSGLYGLALLLHILPTTIGPNPLSVLDHHSLVFLDQSLSKQLTMQMHPAQLILKQLFILSALLNLIRHGTWTSGLHLTWHPRKVISRLILIWAKVMV